MSATSFDFEPSAFIPFRDMKAIEIRWDLGY